MSKSTKIIAGLGVAAALGVAAIPVASFADTAGTHTVTVSATVSGNIIVKADTGNISDATTNITGTSNTGTIDFGNLGLKDQKVHDNVTIIDVETNYPNGYELNADAEELVHATATSNKISRASAQAFTTGTGTFAGATSVWGIKVTKNTSDSLSAGADYTTTDYNAVANGVIDETGAITANTHNKYTMNYGIGIADGQYSGAYSGEIEYTVTATDYTAAP